MLINLIQSSHTNRNSGVRFLLLNNKSYLLFLKQSYEYLCTSLVQSLLKLLETSLILISKLFHIQAQN